MPWHAVDVEKVALENELIKTMKALNCAREFFNLVKRKDGRDEFVHSYRVAQILIFHQILDDDILAAGLLHDVPENINLSLLDNINEGFGINVELIVFILTRIKNENIRFYFARISEDTVTILVKLADRLHNLRNMTKHLEENDFFTRKRLQKQIEETWEYLVPMAVRAAEIGCQYRRAIMEVHEELLRSLADAEFELLK
jgi:GTP pyrophosphokinase